MGLGNPGPEYENSRHNIGFKVIDLWCRDLGLSMNSRRFRAKHIRSAFRGKNILLLCPLTFMNLSGESVRACIGHPRFGETVENYVLAPFYANEKGLAEKAIRVAVNACELFVLEGVESAMNQINCQNLVNKEEKN